MGRRDVDPGYRKGGLVRSGIRSLAGVVGLASESLKAHKDGKAITTDHNDGNPEAITINQAEQPNEHISGEAHDNTENEWDLDDAQDEIAGEHVQQGPDEETSSPEDAFIRSHQTMAIAPGRLPLPVILPQRRPKDRSRGFIRAYAPVLENCGIDQATWLAFLDTLQKSSAADPWLNAINLASIGTMFLPHIVGFVVGYAIQQMTNMTIELQARHKTTKALQKLNEEFFRPRGLFCLIMTWNPESSNRVEQVNICDTIATRSNPPTGIVGVHDRFRSSDGETCKELAFPEVAPLVFPALDELAAQTSSAAAEKKNRIGEGMTFVANYWDKRAAAEYAMENPGSMLAQVPQEEFYSRYADPKNSAASGSLISFVSGGRLIPGPGSRGLVGGLMSVAGQAVRGETQGSEWEQYNVQHSQRDTKTCQTRKKVGLISTPVSAYKKLLKKNVLYLMVVNMPSAEEMSAAKAAYLV